MPTADELLGTSPRKPSAGQPRKPTADQLLQGEPPAAGLTTAQRVVRSAAPSIIGGALGGAVGTIATPFTAGIVNPVTGAAAGAAAGEAVQQFLDPFGSGEATGSLLRVGLAGALPLVPAGLRRFFLSLPGAAAGLQDFLFARLGRAGERVVARFAPPPGTADALFTQARAAGAQTFVPLTETTKVTGKIAKELSGSQFATGGSRALVRKAEAFAARRTVSFDDFRLNQSDLGAVVRSLERKGGAALGRAKLLYAATWDDLEAGLAKEGGPTGDLLRRAVAAYKVEEAAKFVKEAWTGSVVRRAGLQNIDIDAFMTKIDRRRDLLVKLMPKAAIDDILETVRPLANIPTMAKTPRLGFEQMPFAARAVVSGAGAGTAGMLGVGGVEGFLGGAAGGVLATEAVSLALTSASGRAVVRQLASQGATIDQIFSALLQAGRAGVGHGGRERLPLEPTAAPTGRAPERPEPLRGAGGVRIVGQPLIPERFRTPLSGLRIGGEP